MIDIRVNLCEITTKVLSIGLEGEQNHVRIVFDASSVLADCPEAIPSLAVKAPSGVIYPKVVSKEGTNVYWIVSASDCAQDGTGNYQLTFINDEEVIKTFVGAFRVYNSLTTDGPAPDPIQQWIDDANEALGTIEGAVERAENAATASETAQGKAEDAQAAAETAQGLAEAAEEAAEVAEAGAETAQGKAEEAQEAAESARDTAQGYVSDAQGYASAAQGYADDAAGSAETAGNKAQEASGYADDASGYASDAQGYANDASGYADSASGYATQASGYADDASGYATTAGDKATEAAGSATQASQSATTAGNKATEAAGSATSASASALKAEGFAVGQQNGTDVTSGSPYYENNAKYYSEQAEQSAEDAEQTVVEVTNKLNSKAPVVIENASGSIATFSDGADGMPMEVTVGIEPVQDLHGYDNPWPAGGGKNLFQTTATTDTISGVTFTVNSDGSITVSGTASSGISNYIFGAVTLPAGTYKANGYASGTSSMNRMVVYNVTTSTAITTIYDNRDIEFTISEENIIRLYPIIPSTYTGTTTFYPMIRLSSVVDGTFAPYSNICPISGWTGANVYRTGVNLLGGQELCDRITSYISSATVDTTAKTVSFTASASTNQNSYITKNIKFKENTQYTLFITFTKPSGNSSNLRLVYADGTTDNIPSLQTAATKETIVFVTDAGKTVSDLIKVNMGGTTVLYYEESGIFEGVLTATDFVPYAGATYPISWETTAGTVYGGTLTVKDDGTGVLLVDTRIVNLAGLTWTTRYTGTNKKALSATLPTRYFGFTNISPFVMVEEFVAVNGIAAVVALSDPDNKNTGLYWYKLENQQYSALIYCVIDKDSTPNGNVLYKPETPVTYNLTELEVIETLKGINNVWADTGNVSADYPADTKLYINKRLSASQTLLELIVTANREETMKATKAYSTGNLLIVNGTLYRATTSIANGATLTVGTNVTATTIANELAALA